MKSSLTSVPVLDINALGPRECFDAVITELEASFIELYKQRVIMPARTAIYIDGRQDGRQMLVSPTVLPNANVACVKVTTLTPENVANGRDLIQGLVLVYDLETGQVKGAFDGALITGIRTGAVAALATRLLSPLGASRVGLIGTGVQAKNTVEAILCVRPIRELKIYSRTMASMQAFKQWFISCYGNEVNIELCDSIAAAVLDMDIVCTATSTHDAKPLVHYDWIKRGAHINVIGGTNEQACEIDPTICKDALLLVEQRQTAIEEAGEVRAALNAKYINKDDIIELATWLGEGLSSRQTQQTTIFRSVGCGLEDIAAANAIYKQLNLIPLN